MTEAPKCPKCGKPLETVQIEKAETLNFDPDENEYANTGQGSGACRCGSCGAVIGGYGGGGTLWGYWVEDDGTLIHR